ncbi:MAG: cytochrome c oxidase subunit II [Ardenticatenia bacterium]|nr:cytochrome c oxidase subunit II [Ardenticatenia bacterium]
MALAVALLVLGMFPAVTFAAEPPWFLNPASEQAGQVARLFNIELLVATLVFFIVEGLIIYVVIRYRQRGPDDPVPKQIHGSTVMELTWTIGTSVALLFVLIVFWQTMTTLAAPPADAATLEVVVRGQQWWWEFEYPEYGFRTANELYIPVGQPVEFVLESDNVIHSFWVPRLGGKVDVVPGQQNRFWFQADKPGEYFGQCAELCGVQHAGMRFKVFALPPEKFAQWAEEQQQPAVEPTTDLAKFGKELFFTKGCAGCHAIAGTQAQGRIGPDLTHFASRTTVAAVAPRTDGNVARWVYNSEAIKPGNIMWQTMKNVPLSSEEVDALVAYLQGLK